MNSLKKKGVGTFPLIVLLVTWPFPSICDNINHPPANTTSCTLPFEGFGIFLGSVTHFSQSPPGTVNAVVQKVYTDLGIRHFRTSYESDFSTSNDTYDIGCKDEKTCMWNELMQSISQYRDTISIFASVWSPPHYMKNIFFDSLLEEYEDAYYHFIHNITSLIKSKFNLTIERVSPVNEPENIFAPWEHTNMSPHQLCRIVQSKNDSLISLCPENSYFWMTQVYSNYTDNSTGVDCSAACELIATHAYTLNINIFSPYHLLAYYDPGRYPRTTSKPIWMTEVSSTFGGSSFYQMEEGLDFAQNIINFVAHTCVQRYYFWYAFTRGSSGESIIWGYDPSSGSFILPKKYFVFKHFTTASFGGPKTVSPCSVEVSEDDVQEERRRKDPVWCVQFGKTNVVLVNRGLSQYSLSGFQCKTPFCCTTSEFNWNCDSRTMIPSRSVCSCQIQETDDELGNVRSNALFVRANSTIFSNEIPQPTFQDYD